MSIPTPKSQLSASPSTLRPPAKKNMSIKTKQDMTEEEMTESSDLGSSIKSGMYLEMCLGQLMRHPPSMQHVELQI